MEDDPAPGGGVEHAVEDDAVEMRTGDPVWLERARSFPMHAIGQRERMRQQYGRGRCTLWTGDPGLAIYLWHCATGADGMPGLDRLD